MAEQVDVVVLGMGVGGETTAGALAEAGLAVVGVEANLLGGECPYWACIPSKMMLRAGEVLTEGRRIPDLAGTATVTPRWELVARRIREGTSDWDDQSAVDSFVSQGGRFVRGHGRITGPGEVTVGEQVFHAQRGLVIAGGTRTMVPPVPGLQDTPYWTNHEAIEATTVPQSLIVLGGGAVGVELAQAFARFGAHVTLVERAQRLIPSEEPEAAEVLTAALQRDGIDVRTGTEITRVEHDADTFTASFSGSERVAGERLLVATGRQANLAGSGVSNIGLDEDARAVPVDGHLRAGAGTWAVGDITGTGMFTHVAVYQGEIAAADILGRDVPAAEYGAIPRAVFTDPEVGGVGRTEAQASEDGVRVRTAVGGLSARGFVHGSGGDGLIKLVADADRDVLVGATSVGPSGAEVLGLLTLAVYEQVPLTRLRSMIYAFPTFHRAVRDALKELA